MQHLFPITRAPQAPDPRRLNLIGKRSHRLGEIPPTGRSDKSQDRQAGSNFARVRRAGVPTAQ